MKNLFILFILFMVAPLFKLEITHELSTSPVYNSTNEISYDSLKPYLESGSIAFNQLALTINEQNSVSMEPTQAVYSPKNANRTIESRITRESTPEITQNWSLYWIRRRKPAFLQLWRLYLWLKERLTKILIN